MDTSPVLRSRGGAGDLLENGATDPFAQVRKRSCERGHDFSMRVKG